MPDLLRTPAPRLLVGLSSRELPKFGARSTRDIDDVDLSEFSQSLFREFSTETRLLHPQTVLSDRNRGAC